MAQVNVPDKVKVTFHGEAKFVQFDVTYKEVETISIADSMAAEQKGGEEWAAVKNIPRTENMEGVSDTVLRRIEEAKERMTGDKHLIPPHMLERGNGEPPIKPELLNSQGFKVRDLKKEDFGKQITQFTHDMEALKIKTEIVGGPEFSLYYAANGFAHFSINTELTPKQQAVVSKFVQNNFGADPKAPLEKTYSKPIEAHKYSGLAGSVRMFGEAIAGQTGFAKDLVAVVENYPLQRDVQRSKERAEKAAEEAKAVSGSVELEPVKGWGAKLMSNIKNALSFSKDTGGHQK